VVVLIQIVGAAVHQLNLSPHTQTHYRNQFWNNQSWYRLTLYGK